MPIRPTSIVTQRTARAVHRAQSGPIGDPDLVAAALLALACLAVTIVSLLGVAVLAADIA